MRIGSSFFDENKRVDEYIKPSHIPLPVKPDLDGFESRINRTTPLKDLPF
jgi:hypothetical protein